MLLGNSSPEAGQTEVSSHLEIQFQLPGMIVLASELLQILAQVSALATPDISEANN